jgi:light-harvesting protein B-800-850 alpha chain
MNNAKMWLVVKPTVGVPMFLTAVAVGSFAVHVAVLSNTTWVSDFLSGRDLGSGMAAASLLPADADTHRAASHAVMPDGQAVLVILPDGTTARAYLEAPVTTAALHRNGLPLVVEH